MTEETALILSALGRMEEKVRSERTALDRLKVSLGDMAQAIARAKAVADSETAAHLLDEFDHRVDAMLEIASGKVRNVAEPPAAEATPAPEAHAAEPDQVPTVSGVVSQFSSEAPAEAAAEAPQPDTLAGDGAPTVAMLTAMVQALSESMPTAAPEPEAEVPQAAPEPETAAPTAEAAPAELPREFEMWVADEIAAAVPAELIADAVEAAMAEAAAAPPPAAVPPEPEAVAEIPQPAPEPATPEIAAAEFVAEIPQAQPEPEAARETAGAKSQTGDSPSPAFTAWLAKAMAAAEEAAKKKVEAQVEAQAAAEIPQAAPEPVAEIAQPEQPAIEALLHTAAEPPEAAPEPVAAADEPPQAIEPVPVQLAMQPAESAPPVVVGEAVVYEFDLLASFEQMEARPFPPPEEGTAVIFPRTEPEQTAAPEPVAFDVTAPPEAATPSAEAELDPADLFEPEPAPPEAAAVQLPQPEFIAPPPEEEIQAQEPLPDATHIEPPQALAPPPAPAEAGQPQAHAPHDPLHALKAMSVEERIALFS